MSTVASSTTGKPILLRSVPLPTDDLCLTIVGSAAALSQLRFKSDLIVGDGGFYSPEEADTAQAGTVIFVEGVRRRFREQMAIDLARRGLEVELEGHGGRRRVAIEHFLGVPFPTLVRHYNGGCWVGVVRPLPHAAR